MRLMEAREAWKSVFQLEKVPRFRVAHYYSLTYRWRHHFLGSRHLLLNRRRELFMPERETINRAKEDLREGKSPSTAAGEFVREEIEHVREGKHGVRSPEQAIAIGLSKARRAGVPLPPPPVGKAKESTRASAERDYRTGKTAAKKKSSSRARSRIDALKKEPRSTVSHEALSAHAKKAARNR
jgi:hypothetical protein